MWGVVRWVEPELDRREQGNNGELKVAEILNDLRSDGWLTLHDIQTGRGNIDHVAVGPGGIVTVETKSRRGRVRTDQLDRRWLNQAYAQRKWLENTTGMEADSLLVFSDAWLDRMVSRHRGVCVMSARALKGNLQRRQQTFSAEQVESIYRRLAAALAS
jgi:hypothetical protein